MSLVIFLSHEWKQNISTKAIETIAVVWPCLLSFFWINYPFLVTIDGNTFTQIFGLVTFRTVRIPPSHKGAMQSMFFFVHVFSDILLMEEILHHRGCIKPCKSWDKPVIN